jgi:hypothetical protein
MGHDVPFWNLGMMRTLQNFKTKRIVVSRPSKLHTVHVHTEVFGHPGHLEVFVFFHFIDGNFRRILSEFNNYEARLLVLVDCSKRI